jgi:flavin-dependent dehydrogenase
MSDREVSELSKNNMGHAVVIGASIAGLAAAQVLTEHFAQVTIIDRDYLPENATYRRGVPQAHHAHTLLPQGQLALEGLFPGLVEELLDKGAVAVDASQEIAFYQGGQWHTPRARKNYVTLGLSRPLLETTIYGRVAEHPQVRILEGYEALGLRVDEQGMRVTGVHIRDRNDPQLAESELEADVVVDASGRGSQAVQWLESLGYTPPEETTINAFTGYASRMYRPPEGFAADWKYMYIRPTPPEDTRGGVIIPIEGDRWHVSLFGLEGDYPPTDGAEFLSWTRDMPAQELYEALKDAEPLTKPYGYRRTENRLRHYDRLPRYLEGFLVIGDAVYTLNPLYAMGITAAALSTQALAESLEAQHGESTGLARAFQKRLRQAVDRPLKLVITEDQRWAATRVKVNAGPVKPQRTAVEALYEQYLNGAA